MTTLERTLIDLAVTMSQRDLVRAVEGCLVARATTFDRLTSAFARIGARARKVLAALDGQPPSESELEARFVELLESAGLPRPQMQVAIDGVTGENGRVDGFYADRRVIVELDGRRFHARVDAFERDRRRDHAAVRRGLATVRFTHRQIVSDPRYVVEVLTDILRV